jgi:hypothetical protein
MYSNSKSFVLNIMEDMWYNFKLHIAKEPQWAKTQELKIIIVMEIIKM